MNPPSNHRFPSIPGLFGAACCVSEARAAERCTRPLHLLMTIAVSAFLLCLGMARPASAVELLSETFDSGPGGFASTGAGASPVAPEHDSSAGTWRFAGDDSGPSSSMLTSPAIEIPATGALRIRFDHRVNTEGAWDGVVLQWSLNGGAFTEVPPRAFTRNGYGVRLIGSHDLFGRRAFHGDLPVPWTAGFVTSEADLGAVRADDVVRIRFLGAWDQNYRREGTNWELDRVVVETIEDSDGDGMTDSFEQTHGLAADADDAGDDPDDDGLTNLEEFLHGTHPWLPDTDDDGVGDAAELGGESDPLSADLSGDLPGVLGRFDFDGGDDGGFFADVTGESAALAVHHSTRGTWLFRGSTGVPTTATLTSPEITMPMHGGVRILFSHRYSFEPRWDGGVVEVSVNSGPFRRIPGSAFSRNPYTMESLWGAGDLFGEAGFNADSAGFSTGFVTSVADLGGMSAGDRVRLRFLGAWDYEALGTSPNWEIDEVVVQIRGDADGDGIADAFELANGLDPWAEDADPDADGDGLSNRRESVLGTHPMLADSDGDGLGDHAETEAGTDPLDADTDDDGLLDGVEDNSGTFVDETRTGTDPTIADTDGDGFGDGHEVGASTDPRDATDFPDPAPDLEWSAEGLPDGWLRQWPASLNRIDDQPVVFAMEQQGAVASGRSNLRHVNAWVRRPGWTFRSPRGASWQDAFGNAITQDDACWELVFRPGDYEGRHVLFNTGGNVDGIALFLLGSNLEFRFQDDDNDANRVVVSTDLSELGPPTDFYHVVAVTDVTSAGTGTGWLYVNGVLAAGPVTSTGTLNDWSGGNLAELGLGDGVPGSSAFNGDLFTGDVATFGFYSGAILDADAVMARYRRFGGMPAPFQITEITADPVTGSVVLTWNSESGRSYAIDISEDPTSEPWAEVTDGVPGSTGANQTTFTFEFRDGEVPPRRLFWRVRLESR